MPWQPQDIMNQRTEFALRALQTENFRALCREFEISPKIGYKWLTRFKAEGMGGMNDQSRRPRNSPEGTPEQIIYPQMSTRKVNGSGHIKHEGVAIFVSQALAGWQTGLSTRADGKIDLYFARLLLGYLEPETAAFIPALPSESRNMSN